MKTLLVHRQSIQYTLCILYRHTDYDYLKLCEFNASMGNMVIYYCRSALSHSSCTHKMPAQAIEIIPSCFVVIFHIQNPMKMLWSFGKSSAGFVSNGLSIYTSHSLSLESSSEQMGSQKTGMHSVRETQYRLNNSIIVGKLRSTILIIMAVSGSTAVWCPHIVQKPPRHIKHRFWIRKNRRQYSCTQLFATYSTRTHKPAREGEREREKEWKRRQQCASRTR